MLGSVIRKTNGWRRAAPGLGAALLLGATLGGCGSIHKALGLKTDLEGKRVESIAGALDGAQAVCPGARVSLVVTATLVDEPPLITEGAGGGKLAFDSFRFESDAGQVDAHGIFTLTDDPRATLSQKATVRITAVAHPDKTAEVEVPVTYACAFVADFRGAPGRDGQMGAVGQSGKRGKDEQSSPSYAKPGGHGGVGGRGGDGADGGDGQSAPAVQVAVSMMPAPGGAGELLQVEVSAAGATRVYVVDPAGGRLTVKANGGRGGSGGNGGGGGSGGGGGTGDPAGDGGDGGPGGNGGNGGNGGDGGQITLVHTAAAAAHMKLITLESRAGAGGGGGVAGHGGSGGNTFSGGQQGQSGQHGQQGQAGQPGHDGPPPSIAEKG